jgi:hypothetical protein
MSRIQVGDITIDGQNVQIESLKAQARVPQAGLAQPSSAPLLSTLARLPIRPALLAVAGAALVAAGTAVNIVVGVLADPLTALLRGGVLAPLGVGLLVLAGLKAYVGGRSPAVLAASLEGGSEQYLARLRPLLQGEPGACTVPALARTTGWPEATVVRALALLRGRGEVAEELDLDTGEFYYTTLTLPPRDLDSRLGELHP